MGLRVNVLDLYAGLRGWSQAFAERGHEVVAVELEPKFVPDICVDILTWDYRVAFPRDFFDVVLASPPCHGFSVMNIGRNWTREHQPKTDTARLGLRMVERAIEIIDWFNPKVAIIENPRAKLRKMPIMQRFERRTVTYCQLGERRMKPTDLWSDRWPQSLVLPEPCTNGASCHVRAPRGSRTGTQGMDSAESAKIPHALSLSWCARPPRSRNSSDGC